MGEEESFKSEKRQYISMIICWLAYVIVYFGRFSYSANIALIEKDYGVTHASAGLVMTFFSAAYGISQIIHGVFCEKYPRKQIVPFVLICAGVFILFVFFGVPFRFIKYLWLVTGAVQSILWPMVLQVISENVDKKHMSRAILVMSTSTSCGTLLIYGTSAAFADINYKYTFLLGTVLLFIVAAVWYICYKPGYFIKTKAEKDVQNSKIVDKRIFIILPVGLLCIFSVVTNFLKDGIQTWAPVILKSIKTDLPDSMSIVLTLALPLFGIFGAMFASLVNKQIPKAIPLVLFFFGFSALFNGIICLFGNYLLVTVISFAVLELLLHGSACAIVSIFPLRMRERMSSGKLAGILNGSAYAGSAASSFVLGKISDISGTGAVFATLLGTMLSTLIVGLVYLLISKKHPKLNI